ncbi:hypothetical protein LK994_04370 [Ferruginibacter lapsinanis]|uniref:hypothetical protein n=1 Tax=Ferruginibacter lapsinanis TaxID=563172 RepID=UPI001E35DD47|nr:hypothetical protein [Ferruginibacter lapsinanis]UEG50707.1 hypothetical protein LK994_04370 [Ferruginibacter lapsinanis]
MNTTHLHLLLNHFPIIGTLIGSGLLLWGLIKNQNNIKIISSVILALMAIIAIPVYLTGEPAEESVEKLPGVVKTMIELHEDAATLAIWLMGLTGVSALLALFLERKKTTMAKTAFMATFLFSAVCFAAMARTGYYGGQIRHTEISAGAATVTQQNANEKNIEGKENKKEKDDD